MTIKRIEPGTPTSRSEIRIIDGLYAVHLRNFVTGKRDELRKILKQCKTAKNEVAHHWGKTWVIMCENTLFM